jgi:hypothetical protein
MNATDTWRDLCYPEEYTIYMNNLQPNEYNYWVTTPNFGDQYCSSIILGKHNPDKVNGYWNTISNNFNKIRFTTKYSADMYVVITPLFTDNYTEVLI